MLTGVFLTYQAFNDPVYFKKRMGSYLEMAIIILHAPLDIIISIITDGHRYEENLRKYKRDRKKHLFWDQVPQETRRSWKITPKKAKEINLEKSLMETKQAATHFLMNLKGDN